MDWALVPNRVPNAGVGKGDPDQWMLPTLCTLSKLSLVD